MKRINIAKTPHKTRATMIDIKILISFSGGTEPAAASEDNEVAQIAADFEDFTTPAFMK